MTDQKQATTQIRRSDIDFWHNAFFSALFAAGGFWFASGGAVDTSKGEATIYIGRFILVFCGLWAILLCGLFFSGTRIALELSPVGFLDRRLFKNEIPWSSVSQLSTLNTRHAIILKVEIADDAVEKAGLTSIGSLSRFFNRLFGDKSFYITPFGLETSFKKLDRLFQDYLETFQQDVAKSG